MEKHGHKPRKNKGFEIDMEESKINGFFKNNLTKLVKTSLTVYAIILLTAHPSVISTMLICSI